MRRLLPLAGLVLLALSGALAEAQTPVLEPNMPTVSGSGVAVMILGDQRTPVAFSITPVGPLFDVRPLVTVLGGDLSIGPLGKSRTLTVSGTSFLTGPGSPAVSTGKRLTELSQPPIEVDDGLRVPLDFLHHVWGSTLGYSFRWTPGEATLVVTRRSLAQLPVKIDLVHLQGVTTLVLQFPLRPNYSISSLAPGTREVTVHIAGDQLQAATRVPSADPLVPAVGVTAHQISIELAPGARADSYTLEGPFRIVFDVHSAALAAPAQTLAAQQTKAPGVHTIVIDPGHGGRETGAIGRNGTEEKDLTLLLAEALKRQLEAHLPVRCVLTRTSDTEVPLDARSALANQYKADLFISIHLNSSHGTEAHGAETYFLSLKASDQRAAAAAAEENRSDGGNGKGNGDPLHDLQLMLWDLAQSKHLAESQRLATLIQEELNQTLGLRDRGVKQAPFRVLMGAAMPAVLIEFGFLSNPQEEAKLNEPAYRARLVSAVVRAVSRYNAELIANAPGATSAPKP